MSIGSIAKRLLPEKRIRAVYELRECNPQRGKVELLLKSRLYFPESRRNPLRDYSCQVRRMLRKMSVDVSGVYVYPIDTLSLRITSDGKAPITSNTPDFGKILDSDLSKIKAEIADKNESDFRDALLETIEGVEQLSKRISAKVKRQTQRGKILYEYFSGMLYRKPLSFDEAIQKLLFYNALFWQMRHRHVGLGRLDKILYPYYKKDVENNVLTRDKAKRKLIEVCELLHRDVRFKSLSLLGDTGQYILLGGIDGTGNNVENEITEIFLEIFAEHPFADPKLILRINDNTSEKIWSLAIRSICKGSGSPLLMNETKIMEGMRAFGYEEADLSELGTSACWEPLIIGKSFDQNNPFRSASAIKAVVNALENTDAENFLSFMETFQKEFDREIKSAVREKIEFDCSPLYSLFFDDCIAREKDFSLGGAKYAWHGAQVVGLPNAVNALLNIKKYVFEDKILTIERLKDILRADYVGAEDIRTLFLSNEKKFGRCDEEIIVLANSIMKMASDCVKNLRCNGERIKVGFSSPAYIGEGRGLGATPDGRMRGEPLAVHISPISSNIDISEILDFASELDYSGNRLNGNVIDFIVPSAYVKNQDKLGALIRNAFKKGIYELQLNMLDRDTLIDAKAHPEKYPNLIVRVWGFSAYFNDLPEEYKDNLIARAEKYVG